MKKLFVGLVAGIALGLLIAPAPGADTWKRLVERFDECMNKLTDDPDESYQ